MFASDPLCRDNSTVAFLPSIDAVMLATEALSTGRVATANSVAICPAGTVTDGTTVAAGLSDSSATGVPLTGAGLSSETTPETGPPPTCDAGDKFSKFRLELIPFLGEMTSVPVPECWGLDAVTRITAGAAVSGAEKEKLLSVWPVGTTRMDGKESAESPDPSASDVLDAAGHGTRTRPSTVAPACAGCGSKLMDAGALQSAPIKSFLIRLLFVSARKMSPSASTARFSGLLTSADLAEPPSPANPAIPVPAKAVNWH